MSLRFPKTLLLVADARYPLVRGSWAISDGCWLMVGLDRLRDIEKLEKNVQIAGKNSKVPSHIAGSRILCYGMDAL